MFNIFQNNPLLNDFRIGIILIDLNKKIVNVNIELENITGFKKSQLLNNDFTILLKQYNPTHVNPIIHSMQQGKTCFLSNYILKNKNAKNIFIDLISIPIMDKKIIIGSCLMLISNIKSIHESTYCVDYEPKLSDYGLIGESGLMQEVSYLIKTIAPTDVPVLILGETGTGKEIVSNIIHKLSLRNNEIFKIINCATLSENLLENELFGHEKGSYTGAIGTYKGIFETAMNGTIFLDEIGEISTQFQAKLLRILENGEYNRIGSTITRKTNVRIIAATNKNLKKMIKEKKFRDDLYYRLNVFPIHIPPLRERITDIPLLIKHLVTNLNKKYNKNKLGISDITLTLIFGYSFPGNIRELKNIIEHSYIKSKNKIIQDYDLPNYFLEEIKAKKNSHSNENIEDKIIYLMKEFNGNKSKVAKALCISRKTLYNKLKEIDYTF